MKSSAEESSTEKISKNDNVTQLPQAVENGHPEEILHSGSETPLPTAEGKKPSSYNFLKVLAVNVEGLQNKHLSVHNLLTKYNCSIAVLSEVETSHLTAATAHMEGFRAFCPPKTVTGPPEKEVGVLMMISNEMSSSAKPRHDINSQDTVQTIWTEFTDLNLLVCGVYRRWRPGLPDLEQEELSQLSAQILRASSTGLTILIIGDTNLDHSNPSHRRAFEAQEFLQYIDAAGMRHLPTGPTWKSHGLFKTCKCSDPACHCPRSHRTSTVDNAFCSINLNSKIELLEDTIADHLALLVEIELQSVNIKSKLKAMWTRDLSKVNSLDFETVLESYDWSPIYSMSDPDEAAVFLRKNVLSALDKVAPPKLIKFRPDKPPLYLKRDTLKVMALRDSARLSKNRNKFKALRNQANKLIKRDKILSVQARLKKNPGPKQIWQEAKTILGKGRGSNKLPNVTTNSDPMDTADTQNKFFVEKIAKLVDGISSETNRNKSYKCKFCDKFCDKSEGTFKCEYCHKYFSENSDFSSHKATIHEGKSFKCHCCDENFLNDHIADDHEGKSTFRCKVCDEYFFESCDLYNHIAMIHEGKKPFIKEKFKFKYATAGSVAKIIKGLKNSTSIGTDKIPTAAWKLGVEILAGPVAKLINLSLSTGKVPKMFKSALVHPVYKSGGKNPRSPGSYRPISILPALSKILETVVRNSLLDWLEQHNLLPEAQSGFRPKRSVAMSLACSQADWVAAKNRGEAVAVIAYDLSAAFDTIGLGPLTQQLKSFGIVGTPLKWMESYMSDRSQSVVWNDSTSSSINLTHGVPQGSILGPLLFLVMVSELPGYVTHGVNENVIANMMCYADDSTLYASSKCEVSLRKGLEKMSNRMLSFCRKVGLVINSDKTQMLVSGVKTKDFSVKVGNNRVYPSKEMNLLGITYDTKFTTAPYLRQLASDAKTRAAIIARLSYSVPPNLLKLFTNGLLIGKIMAAAPAAIPFRLDHEDKGAIVLTDQINNALKSAARTITRIRLKDKVRSDIVLQKAGLKCLNEMVAFTSATMVWKSKMNMDPLGSLLFSKKTTKPTDSITTRSENSDKAKLPAPGCRTLAANLLARVWNESADLRSAKTLWAAKKAAKLFSQSLQILV